MDKSVSAEPSQESVALEVEEVEKTNPESCEKEEPDFKDQWLRALADLENFRKRAEKEREDALKYSISKFARDCLTVLDALQKALHASEETSASIILEGVRLAEKEFISTLGRHGVQSISVKIGDPFDPTYHQAMLENEATEVPAGGITEILQTGYTLQERLLRPVLVGVAKDSKS
ncbi:MAG: nucleotide exchange factor GrpE [Holosporales bacterium]|nr:nucleotide exchange factor GrpE [Holosporales bacterium]